jgi:DNA gyrase subunit A
MVVADPQGYLLTVCANGYGKRTPFGANVAGVEEEGEEPTPEAVAAAPAEAETAEEEAAPTEDRSAMRYRKQRRGGKGLRDIRTSERNGLVVAVVAVREGDELMLITQQGMVTRMRVDEIRIVGRNTQGVRLINLREEDKVVTAAKIAREDVAETEELPAVDLPPTPPSAPEGEEE